MLSNRRLVVAALLVAAIIAFVVLRPKPVAVDTELVTTGPLTVTVDDEGETRVRQRFVIAAPVSGRLERITLDEGDVVTAETVVARMHPQPLDPRLNAEAVARLDAAEAARREARARVEQANAELEQARRTGARARQLARDGTISKEELERATLDETSREKDFAAARFAAERAEFEVRAAQASLLAAGAGDGSGSSNASAVEITTPTAGTVLRVFEESERVVTVGTPLLQVGDPSDLEIVVDVLSKDAVLIHPGARMWIDEWGGRDPLPAKVRLVEPAGFTKVSALGVEEQRVNVIGDFEHIPPTLGDSFRVEARIVVWEGEAVLQLPNSALFRRQGQWTVFRIDGNRAVYRAVKIGHMSATHAEVLEGLNAGDRVIVHPSDLLSDGVRVAY